MAGEDREILAMKQIKRIVNTLSIDERDRVLTWAHGLINSTNIGGTHIDTQEVQAIVPDGQPVGAMGVQ